MMIGTRVRFGSAGTGQPVVGQRIERRGEKVRSATIRSCRACGFGGTFRVIRALVAQPTVGGCGFNSHNGSCPPAGWWLMPLKDVVWPDFKGDAKGRGRLIWRGWMISFCSDQRVVDKDDANAGGHEREICRFCELV